jgi:integrase
MLARFGNQLDLPDGFTQPYEKSTCREMGRLYRRLYTVAVREHAPSPSIRSLADLVKIEVARSILEYYLERFGTENTQSAAKCAHFLYLAAKYWAKAPADELAQLREWRRTLKPRATGMTAKNRAMLRQFEDAGRVDRLLDQGANARAVFTRLTRPFASDARKLQLALAIELLLAAPVRPQNLASINLSRHLVWGREGGRDTVHLVFPADEVKNDTDLEFRLPRRVIELLKLYLAKARPPLAEAGNNFLFPGQRNDHKGSALLSTQIATATTRILGVRVTGHQFRHLVGFIYLRENPGGHEVVRRLLGHKRIETTIAFYAGMEQAAAIEHYDRFIERLRQRSAQPNPRGRTTAMGCHRNRGA